MKKILITGAAGEIGKKVVSYLLTESKYDITVLDLQCKDNIKYFKRYENRLNIVLGDINDKSLIKFLIRNQDVVIHLAGIMPPFSEYKNNLSNIINIEGAKNIIESIEKHNPSCHLIYLSTTSIYKENLKEVTVKSKVETKMSCEYTKNAYEIEKIIKKNLNHYTIFRIPLIMGDMTLPPIISYINPQSNIEVISLKDVSYAITKAIDNLDILNNNTYNLSGGEKCQTTYEDFKNCCLKIYGINKNYFKGKIINKKKLNSFYIKDSNVLNDILHFQTDNLATIFLRIKNYNEKKTKRKISKVFAKPVIKEKKCQKN